MINLKKLRTERGLSQQALADKFNLSQQSIYKYENNLAEPDIDTLKLFALFFGVSVDYLIGAVEDSTQKETSINSTFTQEELNVIYSLRCLNPDTRNHIIGLINSLK